MFSLFIVVDLHVAVTKIEPLSGVVTMK